MKSILSNDRECFICHTDYDLHRHHIFAGSRRQTSEKEGCWVYLCARHHNMSDEGVHFNRENDLHLKRICQARWEALNGDREDFIRKFGKSYL